MSDQLLGILKIALLALLYLFFARVLWAVWSEVRQTRGGAAPVAQRTAIAYDAAAQPAAPAPVAPAPPMKGRRGKVGRLVVVEPHAREGSAFGLGQELTVGRGDGCTITIPDDSFVSNVHARVFTADGESFVEDLGSTNGTFLNGHRISGSQSLRSGDRVQIGATVLEAE